MGVPADVVAQMKQRKPPAEDALEKVRDVVRRYRDRQGEVADLTERLRRAEEELSTLRLQTLPDMMDALGIDQIGLPAEGNLPAFDAKVRNYYRAHIPVDAPWAPDAYQWLDKNGHGDLIKTQIVVDIPRGDRELAKKIEEALNKRGVPYTSRLSVHHGTQTAWLKEQVEKYGRTPPLQTIGGTVGRIAEPKQRKE